MQQFSVPENFLAYTSIDEGTVMILSTDLGASKSPSMLAQSHQPSAVAFDPAEKVKIVTLTKANNVVTEQNDNELAVVLAGCLLERCCNERHLPETFERLSYRYFSSGWHRNGGR